MTIYLRMHGEFSYPFDNLLCKFTTINRLTLILLYIYGNSCSHTCLRTRYSLKTCVVFNVNSKISSLYGSNVGFVVSFLFLRSALLCLILDNKLNAIHANWQTHRIRGSWDEQYDEKNNTTATRYQSGFFAVRNEAQRTSYHWLAISFVLNLDWQVARLEHEQEKDPVSIFIILDYFHPAINEFVIDSVVFC